MSLRPLPEIKDLKMPEVTAFDISEKALDKWDARISPEANSDDVITIFGEIGYDGNNSSRVAAALRKIGGKDVTVVINSQGGNFFEGVSIYNLLKEHPHKVTVRVTGIAASAASIIAMAGDSILVAKSATIMVHNCSAIIIANRHELVDVISRMEKFDASMASVYSDRTGDTVEAMAKLMDDETYLSGPEAVDMGLADAFLPSDEIKKVDGSSAKPVKAISVVHAAIQRMGYTRSEANGLIKDIKGAKRDAGPYAKRDAGKITAQAVAGLFKL